MSRVRKAQRLRLRRGGGSPGATTVEFALTAPVLFLLAIGAIELCCLNLLRNTAEHAAYEGARRAALPGATAEQAEEATRAVLNAVRTHQASVQVWPPVISDATPQVTVTVRIPMNHNGWVAPLFTRGVVLDKSCTLQRERPLADGRTT